MVEAIGGFVTGMRRVGEQLIVSFSQGLSGRPPPPGVVFSEIRNSDYMQVFYHNIRKISEVDSPTGFRTLELNTRGISSEHIQVLEKLGFAPRGDETTRRINNVFLPNHEISYPVNITIRNYPRLYGQFIGPETADNSVDFINGLRRIMQETRTPLVTISSENMTQLQAKWSDIRFYRNLSDWINIEQSIEAPWLIHV
ncbi:hypothetical protein M5U04_11285 [Xenorhabdus sp. XENO-1]|uniref:hypothetical protein n=1 Tax=Xenorhabdus bovienii TaxID=40576 RepID=UPI0020CA9A49|nr:hypothetical protein [Xenorhabdus bovienii]MCP9268661.1 hypothetical protein [Xenorhabdus bovienii subsp. africana]